MKFSMQRESLLKPLQQVVGVVERRQTLPVLANILVVIKNGTLSLTATDLEVEMISTTTVTGAEEGETTIPARKLMDICKALPDEAVVQVALDGEKERVVVKSGKSRFTLATLPVGDFPNVEEIRKSHEISLKQRELKRLIDKAQFAMAQQDVRYYLNGLMMEFTPTHIRAVATDGHRLALSELAGSFGAGNVAQIIIPRKGVGELGRLLEDSDEPVKVIFGTNHLRVQLPGTTFTSKLIDGKFPDYERVVPKGGNRLVVADTRELKQALARAAILSNEKYRGIRLKLSDALLKAQAHNPEMEEAEEEVVVDFQGEELEIGFNVNYIVDALTAVDTEQVDLKFGDANSSCLIQPHNDASCRYVIMPMRL